jgi:hypothetical protein
MFFDLPHTHRRLLLLIIVVTIDLTVVAGKSILSYIHSHVFQMCFHSAKLQSSGIIHNFSVYPVFTTKQAAVPSSS